MELKYGKDRIEFNLDSNNIGKILKAEEKPGLENPLNVVYSRLDSPSGTKSLKDKIEEESPEDIVIIVNDVSRPTPYEYLLPPLLEKIHKAGISKDEITFIIATGIHDPNTDKQNLEIFGQEIVDNYEIVSHNPDQNLIKVGQLDSGNQLYINEKVVASDFIITTGVILPHYFAGFSGGRKSILPGVAGRSSIEFNHSLMVKLMEKMPPVEENPVSQEMMEAAGKVGIDFMINVVTNSNREIVEVVAGDYKKAWSEGVKVSASMYHVPLSQKMDVAIVSAGGYPRDINLYQAQKALDHADHAVKKGGTIILAAECRQGLGEETFNKWVQESQKPEDNIDRIKEQFELGGHKAFAISKVVQDKDLLLLSSLDKETTNSVFAQKIDSLKEGLNHIDQKYKDNYKTVIMPQGGLTVPVLEK